MKLFLSWSGARSHAVAEAFRDFLPRVVQAFEPWLSSMDLSKGAAWADQILGALKGSNGVGLFFVTRDAQASRWLHFEAGAIAALGSGRVCVIRVGLNAGEVGAPLNQFQGTSLEKADLQRLIAQLNDLTARPIPSDHLAQSFESAWPKFSSALEASLKENQDAPSDQESGTEGSPTTIGSELVNLLQGMNARLAGVEHQLQAAMALRRGIIESELDSASRPVRFRINSAFDGLQGGNPNQTIAEALAGLDPQGGGLINDVIRRQGVSLTTKKSKGAPET